MSLMVFLSLTACDYVEHTREIGYKGRARANPYLAAERMLEAYDLPVSDEREWPERSEDASAMFFPVSILQSRQSIDQAEQRLRDGAHVVIFMNHGESHRSDWSEARGMFQSEEALSEAFLKWAESMGMKFEEGPGSTGSMTDPVTVQLAGKEYEIGAAAGMQLYHHGEEARLVSFERFFGRLTFIADARPFRNRYIGDHQHAALLIQLVELSPESGPIRWIRSASLSLWALLWDRVAPFLIGIAAVVAIWLWKNLPRFGPVQPPSSEAELRAFDQHLEALGDFHWRLDQAEALLRPLRAAVLERGQRLAHALGQPDADIFQLLAERAGLSRERAERAMIHERPRDAAVFTRVVADLQTLHLHLT
jgi:hypothetical protein